MVAGFVVVAEMWIGHRIVMMSTISRCAYLAYRLKTFFGQMTIFLYSSQRKLLPPLCHLEVCLSESIYYIFLSFFFFNRVSIILQVESEVGVQRQTPLQYFQMTHKTKRP